MGDFSTNYFVGADSESSCVCAHGMRFDGAVCVKCNPLSMLDCPGGYQQIQRPAEDTSPSVVAGYMSMPTDPLSVYECVGRERRCPGLRSPYEAKAMCGSGFAGMRCAQCADNFFIDSEGLCKGCPKDSLADMLLRLIPTLLLKNLLIFYMYMRWNRPNPSGLITVGCAITFIQMLQVISRLPLDWPKPLLDFFKVLNFFSIRGITIIAEFRLECLVGSGYTWR